MSVVVDIEYLEDMYFSNDEPVPYSLKCGKIIKIYPIKVKNWTLVGNCLDVLLYQKDEVPDINIIKMSYFEFIAMLATEQKDIFTKLAIIMKYSLGIECISIEKNLGKVVLGICDENENIDYFINSKEFDDIKKIILFQNICDFDDREISKDVRELYQSYLIATGVSNQVEPTLEKKKIFVMSKVGMQMKDINDMSYRIFSQLYATNIEVDLFYAKKILQASEKYEFKEDVVYPLFEKKKDKYDVLFVQRNSLDNKLSKIQG